MYCVIMAAEHELLPILSQGEDRVTDEDLGKDMFRARGDAEELKPLAGRCTPPVYGTSSGGDDGSSDGDGGDGDGNWNRMVSLFIKWTLLLRDYLTFWRRKPPSNPPPRTIYFMRPEKNKESRFCSNKISTTKYNLFTFLPRFLFDQFSRYANLFFLLISLLQQVPGVSPTGRYTTIVPLSLILIAVAIKEIIEDFRRFRADNQVNYSKVEVLCRNPETEDWRSAEWVNTRWTKVKVGDIVCVENGSFFPADLLLLSSKDEQGICYVETSNLDGENNLKIRQAHPQTTYLQDNLSELENWHVECEGPNNRLYDFTGNIINGSPQGEESGTYPLQPDQILLRGAQLRNTTYILGLVIYTGHDSKLLQNTTRAPLKRSRMENVTNRQVVSLFLTLLVLAISSSICASIWSAVVKNHWYLPLAISSSSRFVNFLKSIITFIILYNNLIPISLIVTLETVKFIQAFFINWDLDMYDAKKDTPALARNSNLNEELGQVKYVFSDKTGTLTENIMLFKKCSVMGKLYDLEGSSDGASEYTDLKTALERSKGEAEKLKKFLLVFALCHTVIPEVEEGMLHYHASSPDEEALVKAAKDLGVVFKARTPDAVIVEVDGRERKYEILNLLEFNSVRKRMSVIVRTPDGVIKLLCKGADSVIYERMAEDVDPYISEETGRHLEYFAVEGFRTLCIAERELEESVYKKWDKKYCAASVSLVNREKELDQVAEEIEKELKLLGASAIEDKLQEGVPQAIASLREAGMKVWILTGDKQETAINIGFASRQLNSKMTLLIINGSAESVKQLLTDHVRTYHDALPGVNKESNAALIIDGKALTHALEGDTKEKFLDLALTCKSVICSRVSPLQKAEVVNLVQKRCKKEVTLAIGDGANDVGMIQAAHVGVGISGREGLQATLASDYAIAQFRFLLKLLLVHGAWNYNRQAKIILFSFYKNICLYIIEFWFAWFSLFSGQALFERWTIGLFNVLFTSAGLYSLGWFEQDLSAASRLSKPRLYKSSQEGKYFNSYVFWKWVGLSLYHSMIAFFIVYFMLRHETPFGSGKTVGYLYVGNTVYTCVVIIVNLKLALESRLWPWIHHATIWGSIIVWFLFLLIYSHFWPTFPVASVMVGQDSALYGSLDYYAIILFIPALAMLPDLCKTIIQKVFKPTDVDKERLAEIRSMKKGKDGAYQSLEDRHFVVSYSANDYAKYGDGLEPDEAISPLIVGRTPRPNRGFAFAQEDHDSRSKGTVVQRRTLIRMFTTKRNGGQGGTRL